MSVSPILTEVKPAGSVTLPEDVVVADVISSEDVTLSLPGVPEVC